MPTPAKRTENMTKHLTNAEKEARGEAATSVQPVRDVIRLKPPGIMKKNPAAGRYWRAVLKRMDGIDILDDLDSDALGVYCVMLSRHEALTAMRTELAGEDVGEMSGKDLIDYISAVNALESKQQALERNLLAFAEKLGLTPSGRARLAARRAENDSENDPNSDLFG